MPGPKPKYQPQFETEEIAEARRIARQRTAPSSQVHRAKMVVVLSEHPDISHKVLAQGVGIHPRTVMKWRKRWAVQGFSLLDQPRSGRPPVFSPESVAEIKAIACQLPVAREIPLSRFSLAEMLQEIRSELTLSISKSTLFRILKQDAIRPWFHRSWISVKDPRFLERAGPVLDLYRGYYEGVPLGPKDYVLSADEKSQLQILEREFPSSPPGPGRPVHCESDYKRHGTVAYLAALDIRTGRIFGRVDQTTGIDPFQALVDLVMKQEPYASAERVFWILDNGSSHHPSTSPGRLQEAYPNLIAIHLPVHASWLNQIEIYFSILQRKALTPNDLGERRQMEDRILGFERRYNQTSKPFKWRFTRSNLEERLRELKMAA